LGLTKQHAMMTFIRGKALVHALVILPSQKEYPLQLDKKFDNFRACVDAVEKKKCLPIAGINPPILSTSKS